MADDISIWYDVGGIIGKASYSCLMAMSAYMVKSVYILTSSGPRNVSHLYKINKRK